MGKVSIRATPRKTRAAINTLKKSAYIGDQLEPVGQAILRAASSDPNPAYVAGLRLRRFTSSGPGGRVSIQVGSAPRLGARVEAKRGTMARAAASAGF